VPPLPDAVPAGLSVRELTERHRKDANCAACHVRIDPYGMTLEQFDAIGRLRPASAMKPTAVATAMAIHCAVLRAGSMAGGG
jgi:hypothetical protein